MFHSHEGYAVVESRYTGYQLRGFCRKQRTDFVGIRSIIPPYSTLRTTKSIRNARNGGGRVKHFVNQAVALLQINMAGFRNVEIYKIQGQCVADGEEEKYHFEAQVRQRTRENKCHRKVRREQRQIGQGIRRRSNVEGSDFVQDEVRHRTKTQLKSKSRQKNEHVGVIAQIEHIRKACEEQRHGHDDGGDYQKCPPTQQVSDPQHHVRGHQPSREVAKHIVLGILQVKVLEYGERKVEKHCLARENLQHVERNFEQQTPPIELIMNNQL